MEIRLRPFGVGRRSHKTDHMTRHEEHPVDGRGASKRRGFTLIEILVVIVVIAVMAGLVAPNVFKHVGEAKNVSARSQIEMLGAALDA